jgi:hypothetical protein
MTTTEQAAETTTVGAWVAGHNLAGYSPDPDNVAAFATWGEAWAYLADEATRQAEQDDDAVWLDVHDVNGAPCDECAPRMLAQVEACVSERLWTENGVTEDAEHAFVVEDSAGRSIVWWVHWSPESTPDEDE